MRISKIRNALLRKLWLILLISFVGAGLTGAVCKFLVKPVYQSKIIFYIFTKSSGSTQEVSSTDYNQLLANNEMLKDYIELLTSNKVLQGAIDSLGIKNLTADQLAKNIKVVNNDGSSVLSFTVNDNSSGRSAQLANAISKQFVETVQTLTDQNNINIVDKPVKPRDPIPNTKFYVAIAFSALFLASTAMVILAEYFDNTIRAVDDIEQGLGLNMIGIIPEKGIK